MHIYIHPDRHNADKLVRTRAASKIPCVQKGVNNSILKYSTTVGEDMDDSMIKK